MLLSHDNGDGYGSKHDSFASPCVRSCSEWEVPCSKLEGLRSEVEVSCSEHGRFASRRVRSCSKVEVSCSKLKVPSSELKVLRSEVKLSRLEVEVSSSKVGSAKHPQSFAANTPSSAAFLPYRDADFLKFADAVLAPASTGVLPRSIVLG